MFAIFPPTPDFCHAQGFPLGGSCRRSRLMRGRVLIFELSCVSSFSSLHLVTKGSLCVVQTRCISERTTLLLIRQPSAATFPSRGRLWCAASAAKRERLYLSRLFTAPQSALHRVLKATPPALWKTPQRRRSAKAGSRPRRASAQAARRLRPPPPRTPSHQAD